MCFVTALRSIVVKMWFFAGFRDYQERSSALREGTISHQSISLSVCCLFVCLSVCLSVCQSVCQSAAGPEGLTLYAVADTVVCRLTMYAPQVMTDEEREISADAEKIRAGLEKVCTWPFLFLYFPLLSLL